MDKFERVRAALRSDPLDHVPVSFYYHFPADQRAGRAMARAHIGYYRASDPDFLKVMNDNYYSPPDFRGLSKPADWPKLRPARLSSRCFQDQLTGLREIVRVLGREVPIITTVFNPFQDGDGLSDWKATEHLKADPENVSEGLAIIADSLAEFVVACVEAGAWGIFFAAHGGQVNRHTEEEFNKFVKPHDLTVLRAAEDAGAVFNLLHLCGETLRLPAYSEYPAHAVNWSPQLGNLSLKDGRRLFRRTIVGGVDQRGPILRGDREEIAAEVRRAVDEMGKAGSMISAGCALAEKVPSERLLWAKEAAITASSKQV